MTEVTNVAAPQNAFGGGGVDWSNAGINTNTATADTAQPTPAPEAQKTPHEANTTQPEKPAASGEQKSDIENPQAWLKATEEKYQRLLSKRDDELKAQSDQITKLQEQLKGIEENAAKAFEQRLAELEASIRTERETAQKATIEAQRAKITVEFNLPAELANRLQGSTEDELRADAEKLAALLPKRSAQQRPPLGASANEGTPDLSWFLDQRNTFGRGGVYTQGE